MSNNLFRAGCLSCRACGPMLVGYSELQLEDGRRARVEAHLAACPSCRAELARIVKIADTLRSTHASGHISDPDLWQALEAKIRVSPQHRAGWSFARAGGTSGTRNPFLGDSGWGQALPVGATVFAAGILVFVVVDSMRHSATNTPVANIAAAAPRNAEKPGDEKPQLGDAPVRAAAEPSDKLAGGARVADLPRTSEQGAHVKVASRVVSSVAAHGAARSERHFGLLRRLSGNVEIAGADAAPRIANIDHRPSGSRSAAARGREALISHESVLSRNVQIAAVTEKPEVPEVNVDRDISLSAPSRLGTYEADVRTNRRRSPSVVAVVSPSRGSYAVDDDADSNVSFADASGSLRRQQGLFSY